jgi:uncharacterized delta-60 repeat protein
VAGAAAGALLVLAGPAAAAPDQPPVRFWSVSKVERGIGELPVSSGAQVGDKLQKTVDVGRVVFNLPLHAPYWFFLPRDRAFGSLFSSASGVQYSVLAQAPTPNPVRPGAPEGTITHLDEYQAYRKQDANASLRITLSDLLLQTIDDNNSSLGAFECPSTGNCEPVRAVVRFHARAYAASAGGDFYDAGGIAYLEGHQHSWRPGAATSGDAPNSLWDESQFDVDGDADDSGTGAAGVMDLKQSRRLKVPLAGIHPGELFAVHVTLEAEAVDERGGESAAQAFIQDPQHGNTGLLTTHGLKPRGKPRFKEPRVKPLPAARCPAGPHRHAGTLQLASASFGASESSGTPFVLVRRRGGSRGATSVTVRTSAGSAQAGHDFTSKTTRLRFGSGDASPRLVEIPIREDRTIESPERFSVSLDHARCAKLGKLRSAQVTIIDDDQVPPPPPPPGFRLGGTVDGLQGSGLVLQNFGSELPVSGNGSFTFPATLAAGQPYDVGVKTQPHGPAQVCTVQNGRGKVGIANVTGIAVHCVTPTPASGLDTTFGTGGLVSTPVGGGHGEAVVIQPGGAIVTAGWRTAAAGTDFALTRHDSAGNLDHNFGTGGIVTTDLGGPGDEAYDAALTPDGGVVVVGATDAPGIQKQDFGIVRYKPDGTPDAGFGSSGIVTTDFFAHGDVANAVAVQPDGKIVVAGFAVDAAGINGDFALARYNANGTLDTSFGTNGLVTTDLGSQSDDARAVAIQPDGRIVVAGSAGEAIALARYMPDGKLDAGFGTGGSTVTDLGSDEVAAGVALTPGGEIVIAGYTLGPNLNRDFLLARYRADGTLDSTFGDHGIVKTDLGSGDDFAESVAVDAKGRIVLVGRATSATILDMALVRYRPDGTLDTSFDGDGIVTADFHGRGEFGQDLAFDAAGRIVAAGYTANGSDTEFALMRANS